MPGRAARVMTAALVAAASAVLIAPERVQADAPADEVHYTYTGATSVSLDWRGTAQDVRYGLTTDYGMTATGAAPAWTPISSPGPFWQAEISGLAAGTTYHYSIGNGPDYAFATPPAGDFRFDAIGDVGDTSHFSHLANTLSAIAADQPAFVLMLGDLSYANATGATQAVVDQHFNDMMAVSTQAAYLPAWGNHEWESPDVDDLRNYKGRLLMPHAAASPGAPAQSCCGNDWGWFDAGGVRFISYPEPYVSGTWSDWQTHANDLMTQAQNDPSIRYVVTFGHRPAYSTGFHPGNATLAGILDGLGAAFSKYVLNVNGHSHNYERFQPISGVAHLTAGTPSSLEGPWGSTDPRSAFRALHLAHLRVDMSGTGMRIQAICDDAASSQDVTCAAGSVLDEYTIGTPPPAPAVTTVYVDNTRPNCADTGPGSLAEPFCTIAKGTSRLLPGGTVYIGNGSYPEQVSVPVSGTATAPVTVAALPDTAPVVGTGAVHGIYLAARNYVTVSGLTVSGATTEGVYTTGCDQLSLSGLRVTQSGQPTATGFAKGFKLIGTTNSTVTGNTADHNTDSGIYLAQGSTGNLVMGNTTYANARVYTRAAAGIDMRSPGNFVLDNVTHDNEDSGIQLYTGSDGTLVANNVTYRNGDHGIDDFQATNQQIVGNSAYRNATAGINLEGGSTGGSVRNNISVDNGLGSPRSVGNIRVDASAQVGTTVNDNLVYLHAPGAQYVWGATSHPTLASFAAATGQESRGIQADPRWASPDSGNFALTAGSPAIDSADATAPGEQQADIVGTHRYDDPAMPNGPTGYHDRGAYEAPAGTTDASPQPVLTVSPASGTAPLSVTANAGQSTDTDSTGIASYTFDFGDGTTAGPQSGATASHAYAVPGTYVLAVSVTDTAGLTTTATVQVAVGVAGNLVGNSTFEVNLNGWVPQDGCTLTRMAAGHNEGWAADLANPWAAAQTCTLNDSPNWVTRTVAGRYTATAWVRTTTLGGQIKLRIREYNGSVLLGTATTIVNPTGDWQQIQASWTAVSPGSTIDLNVYQTNQPAGSELLVDDVTLSSG